MKKKPGIALFSFIIIIIIIVIVVVVIIVIIIINGEKSLFFISLSSVEMYDPASNQWTSLHGLTVPRRGLGGAVIQGTLYAAGGHDGTHYLNSVEKYSSYTQGWTVVGHLEDSRGRFGFV